MKGFKTYIPALVSGTALIFCFPRFDYYLLAWVALAPFLISLKHMEKGQAFRAGILLGLPYFFGTQYWIYHSINHYGGVSFSLSLLIVFLLSLYESLYTAVFGYLFSILIRRGRLPALFLAPVIWVSLEFLRSYAITGFPWSSLGYSQYKFLPSIQFADIAGVYGVSAFIMAVNGAIADISILRSRTREMPLFPLSYTISGYAALFIIAFSVFAYGYFRLNEHRTGQRIKVSVIQGNIPQDVKWDARHQREIMDIYETLTTGASFASPSLIVWPESAAPFYFGADRPLTEELVEFESARRIPLLFGAVTVKEKGVLSNSAVLLDGSGEVSYIYDKMHLVPFGEYIPVKGILFFVDRLAEGVGDYKAGREYKRAKTPFGEFGVLICYEIIFPGLVRKFFRDGGDFIVTITNDAWFGNTAGPYQHWSMAVLRAVENRKPVIRAANTGVSGFIDSSGRIIKSTSIFERLALTADVTTDGTRTFYSRYGDIFSFLCIVLTLLLVMNIRR
jgi:apolipoprotein N-acyltransferase